MQRRVPRVKPRVKPLFCSCQKTSVLQSISQETRCSFENRYWEGAGPWCRFLGDYRPTGSASQKKSLRPVLTSFIFPAHRRRTRRETFTFWQTAETPSRTLAGQVSRLEFPAEFVLGAGFSFSACDARHAGRDIFRRSLTRLMLSGFGAKSRGVQFPSYNRHGREAVTAGLGLTG